MEYHGIPWNTSLIVPWIKALIEGVHDDWVVCFISQSISLKLYIPYSNHGARNVAVGAGPSGSDRLSAFQF